MNYIFEVVDKSRRKIHLSRERWLHILMHPEMSNQIESIKNTLEKPDVIIQFEYDLDVRFYYKYYKERKEYLFISVKYLNGKGFVLTAYFVPRITY